MGQKCNPTGLRIGVIKNWDSRWYAKKGEFGDTLVEDYKLRNYLLESLHGAGVPKVEIEEVDFETIMSYKSNRMEGKIGSSGK